MDDTQKKLNESLRTVDVLGEVADERRAQRDKWGNEHDDNEGYPHLASLAGERAFTAGQTAVPVDAARKFLVQTAALAVAAIETIDRNNKKKIVTETNPSGEIRRCDRRDLHPAHEWQAEFGAYFNVYCPGNDGSKA